MKYIYQVGHYISMTLMTEVDEKDHEAVFNETSGMLAELLDFKMEIKLKALS